MGVDEFAQETPDLETQRPRLLLKCDARVDAEITR